MKSQRERIKEVACPSCGVGPGISCSQPDGAVRPANHWDRYRHWLDVQKGRGDLTKRVQQ